LDIYHKSNLIYFILLPIMIPMNMAINIIPLHLVQDGMPHFWFKVRVYFVHPKSRSILDHLDSTVVVRFIPSTKTYQVQCTEVSIYCTHLLSL